MPLKGGIGNWIKDFKKSDAPQFKGKSDEKKRDMAIAAYLDAKKEERDVSENAFRPPHISLAHMNRMKKHNISFKQADDMLKKKKKKPEVEKPKTEESKPTRLKTYLNESTNWKGSKSIHLTRYAARQGFGVQLTQVKAMPGNRIPVTGLHISMPIKEIPELIKGLQNVYKAPKGAQLGDNE